MNRLLIVLTIALIIVAGTMVWMWQTYIPAAALWDIYLEMTLVLQFLSVMILLMTAFGIAIRSKRNVKRVNQVAILAVIFGVFGAVYGELNTHFGTLIDNFINFTTLAPMRTESLVILALGLFGAVIVLTASQLNGTGSKA